MKIIAKDNFDRETISERLIEEGLDPDAADTECARLNSDPNVSLFDWFVVVPEDHVLYEGSQ